MKNSIEPVPLPIFMLARNLRVLIADRRESMSSVARRAGISRKTLQNWTSGQMPQDLTKLYRLSLVLQVPLEKLCFGEKDELLPRPIISEDLCEVVLVVPRSSVRTRGPLVSGRQTTQI